MARKFQYALFWVVLFVPAFLWADVVSDVETLFAPDAQGLSYAEIKLAIDQIVDPSLDADASLAKIDYMASVINTAIKDDMNTWERQRLERFSALIEADGGSVAGIGVDLVFGALEHGAFPGATKVTRPTMNSRKYGMMPTSTANASKGQTSIPRDLAEQIAVGAVRSSSSAGRMVRGQNDDTLFAAKSGWQKMEQVFDGLGPNQSSKITVHYQVNSKIPDMAWDVKVVFNGAYP